MPMTDEDVFASMQRELKYESHLSDARKYLETAKSDPSYYDRAITEVSEARRFLAPGASSSELDAIIGVANSGKQQVERDRTEQQRRLAEEQRQKAETDALAKQQEEEKKRQREEEEERQKRQQATIAKWVVGIIVGILLIGWLAPYLPMILGGIIGVTILIVMVYGFFS